MNRAGKGFLQPDDIDLKEIAIPENATGTALHEDRVLVRRAVRAKGLRSGDAQAETGEVVRILERRRRQMVGTLQRGRQFLHVIPDDPRIPHDIYVPEPRDLGRPARVGDKVVVELKEWVSRHTNPEGEIIEVIGAPDAEGVDMLSVLRQYDLPLHFPKAVLHEAHTIGSTMRARDPHGRVDCRRRVCNYVERLGGRIVLARLPADPPELNPSESIRGHLKRHALANFCPKDIPHLGREARRQLRRRQRRTPLIRAFWPQAELAL